VTPNLGFKVIVYLQVEYRKTAPLKDKVTILHKRKLYLTYGIWYYVWWSWLTTKCVARVCQHQLSFLFCW